MLGWKDVSNYDFNVITLFEEIQLQWLFTWKEHEVISVLLKKYPTVCWHMKHKAPRLRKLIEELENKVNTIVYSKELEERFIVSLEDWIVYVVDPDNYDKQPHNSWDTNELLSITDFTNKTIIDIGSGTGSQTFRVAHLAKTVYSVEPVGNLRLFIKQKAKEKGLHNIYVVDGLMTDIPYPDDFCDIVMAGHVFGDEFINEYNELSRVVKPGGIIILIPGNNDQDNDTHAFLIEKGFHYGSFLEPGDGMKRKYWKII